MKNEIAARVKNAVLLTRKVRPGDIGSRRVAPDDIARLVRQLRDGHVDSFSHFSVWRFGEHELLEYPADMVHEALSHYDVCRIWGKGYRKDTGDDGPFLEIDLWNGGHTRNWDWLFYVSGPRDAALAALRIIQDNVDRWPRTWHWVFHMKWLYQPAAFLLLLLHGWLVPSLVFHPSAPGWIGLGMALYLLLFSALVIGSAGALTPYIWFYRPGSPIELRRNWLPRLSVFALLSLLMAIIGNILYGAAFK